MSQAVSLLNETRISLTSLAREQRVAVCTAWRWAQKGVRGICLETALVGGKRITSREAFARFVASTTQASSCAPSPAPRTAAARQRAINAAKAELAKAGISKA